MWQQQAGSDKQAVASRGGQAGSSRQAVAPSEDVAVDPDLLPAELMEDVLLPQAHQPAHVGYISHQLLYLEGRATLIEVQV